MAIVVVLDKPCIRKSSQSGLHHRQFADPRVIVGKFGGAYMTKARTPLAFARPHLPAAAGRGEKRIAQIACEGGTERGDRRENHAARFEFDNSQMIIDIDRKSMISSGFEELMNLCDGERSRGRLRACRRGRLDPGHRFGSHVFLTRGRGWGAASGIVGTPPFSSSFASSPGSGIDAA